MIEQENILAHLAQFYNPHLDSKKRSENLVKSHNHMIRVTLDLHKLVWVETKERLEPFILDDKKRLAFNVTESEALKLYESFLEKAREARTYEMSHVGNNPLDSIKAYEEVNGIGNTLLGKLDDIKAKQVTSWARIFRTKEFLYGVLASLVASVIFYFFVPC